ncbi:MAG: outer membrane beta-barrel protein [Cyclobacteriaceae bacterium]
MKLWPLILVLISFKIFGQDADNKQYIVLRDSSKYIPGEVFYYETNLSTLNFRRYKKDPIMVFNSNEILEFGTKNGSVYSSELIDSKYQFLKKLSAGEHTLLLLEKKREIDQIFFLKNSALQRLQRESLINQIEPILSNKRYGSQIAKRLKYNKRSLFKAVTYSNSDNNFYPKIRYGILTGLNGKALKLEWDKTLSFESAAAMSYGAFVEIPIEAFSQFSTRMEIQFSESSHSLSIEGRTAFYGLAKIQSISLPFLLRYRFISNNNVRFFSNIGSIWNHNFVSSNQIVTISTSPRVIGISELLFPDQMLGGAIGAGAEYSLSYGKDLGLEVRYQYLGSIGEIKMTENTFQMICTLNF